MPWRAIGMHLDVAAFGVNAFGYLGAGERIINEHDESDTSHEELYAITQGRARFEVDGEVFDAPAGTFVLVAPQATRTVFAEEDGTALVAFGGEPGKAYQQTGWPVWAPLHPLYEAGDYEGVIAQGRELIEAHPTYGGPLYNLACCESLAGHPADAVEHLRAAIDTWEEFREMAAGDSDFDPIRDDPAFQELVPKTG